MLKRSEWSDIAERSAAASFGSHHWRKYAFRHQLPVYAGLALLAALGFGAWWLQHAIREAWASQRIPAPEVTVGHSGIPSWIWVGMGVLALLTFIAFRPGRRADPAPTLLGKIFGLGILWLISIGLVVGFAL